jgi:hypothetical protein
MIRMPRRSVTRFFIPLIDVLILLFAIFLLMPLFKSGDAAADPERLAREERLRGLEQELDRLRRQGSTAPADLEKEIEKLRQERAKDLQARLVVRILETDPKTGRIFYYDSERAEVRNEADARALIDRDRREHESRDLLYLILVPRVRANEEGLPKGLQREQYLKWFEGVALRFEAAGAPLGGGKQP